MNKEELFDEITNCNPANEAEVETKILLNVFKLLDFTYKDRADKPTVRMKFGRERKSKVADFIIYNGNDRSVNNALMTVEAKKKNECVKEAINQVKSYSAWAGTPYYLVCDGNILIVSKYNPHSIQIEKVEIEIKKIKDDFQRLYEFANKTEMILNKERIDYINTYFPEIEKLHPVDFFREYMVKFSDRFSYHSSAKTPLTPNSGDYIELPVNVEYMGIEYDVNRLSDLVVFDNHSFLVEGDPGSGKTTLSSKLALTVVNSVISNSLNVVPVYISLRDTVPNTSYEAFKDSCNQLGVRVFENIYRKKIEDSNLIIIMDGLDELQDVETGFNNLEKLKSEKNIHSLIITYRPHVFEKKNDKVKNLESAKIVKLKRQEVFNIAKTYNIDIREAITNASLDLFSPLQLLMYIKLKLEGYSIESTTLFVLYKEYIKILTKYFNDTEDQNYINSLIETFTLVSSEINRAYHQTEKVTINGLYKFVNKNKVRYLSDLVKCGLLSSTNGKITFMHKSFEEFAIASGIVQSIRTNNEEVLKNLSLSTVNTYKVAGSDITQEDIENILILLNSAHSRVRKRVFGVVKYSNLRNHVDIFPKMLQMLYDEKSLKFKKSIYQILVHTSEAEMFMNLLEYNGLKKSTKEFILNRIDKYELTDELFKIIDENKNALYGKSLSYWLLIVSLKSGVVNKFLFQLVDLIVNENTKNKHNVFELITIENNRIFTEHLIRHLYFKLTSEVDVLNLLYKEVNYLHTYEEEVLINILNRIEKNSALGINDFRRLRNIHNDTNISDVSKSMIERIIKKHGYIRKPKPLMS